MEQRLSGREGICARHACRDGDGGSGCGQVSVGRPCVMQWRICGDFSVVVLSATCIHSHRNPPGKCAAHTCRDVDGGRGWGPERSEVSVAHL